MKGKAIHYSAAERAFISTNRTLPRATLYALFCKTFNRYDVTLQNINSLRKRNGWLTGRTGRFKKGNIPHPHAHPKGPNKTSFKKGHKPANHRPVGTERINTDGYVEIKTAEGKNNWHLKQRLVWEQHHGILGPHEILRFLDNNIENCAIENLVKVTRQEHAILNKTLKFNDVPRHLKKTAITLAKAISKTSKLQKQHVTT